MDEVIASDMLEALADAATARKMHRQIQTLRGVRGTPLGEVARTGAALWLDSPPSLPDDAKALTQLFGTAWEDGLLAIGLLAAMVPDAPEAALELGLSWAERVDDLQTADALGWLVLGPAANASGLDVAKIAANLGSHRREDVRRTGVMTAMACTTAPIEGPSAAPLRERLNAREVRVTDSANSDALHSVCSRFVGDQAVSVRKALRRVLRAWSGDDPAAVVAWADSVHGGLPKLLQPEIKRARRRSAG